MPQQSSPPYFWAAQQYPRQLHQWDDINNQGGKLQKTKTFITLDTFAQNVSTWNGYSDIVYSFNFESPNNFTITYGLTQANYNFAFCISYVSNGVVTRYLLWDAVGSNLNQNISVYTGQVIKKNFRLEVWNTSQGAVSNSAAFIFYTSVSGQFDYRYAFDVPLVIDDGLNNNFECINNQSIGPVVVATNQWKPSGITLLGGAYLTWNPAQGTGSISTLVGTPTVNAPINTLPQSLNTSLSEVKWTFGAGLTSTYVYLILQRVVNNASFNICQAGGTQDIQISVSPVGGVVTVSLYSLSSSQNINSTISSNQFIALEIVITALTVAMNVYDIKGNIISTSNTIPVQNNTRTNITGGLIDSMFELITTTNKIDIASYLNANYGKYFIPLPLTFQSTAVSQNNI